MTSPKNGNGTRWMLGILATLGLAVCAWTLNHHESDMGEVSKNTERTVRLDANMENLKDDVAEIKRDVKKILKMLPKS